MNYLEMLVNQKDLSYQEARGLVEQIMEGKLLPVQVAGILVALRMKRETVDEIRGCIEAVREHMISITAPEEAIDTCGTGGDGTGTFNISTAVALVVAGAGVPVVKHGNRKASSDCGSADVLEALGVNIMLSAAAAQKVLEKVGMVFLFAPLFHPSMKYVAPVRKELGIRTVFNFIGPFCNPAKVRRQIIGVPNKQIAEKLAEVALTLDYHHLMIVTNEEGLDEVGISSPTHVYEIQGKNSRSFMIRPEEYGIKQSPLATIRGGDVQTNATIIKQIVEGERGSKHDVVVLNSALALVVAGKIKTIKEGIEMADASIQSGAGRRVLEKLINHSKL